MRGLDPTNPTFWFSLTLLTTRQFTFHNYSDWRGFLLGSIVELIITSSKDFSCIMELVQILYSQGVLASKQKLNKVQTTNWQVQSKRLHARMHKLPPLWRAMLVL